MEKDKSRSFEDLVVWQKAHAFTLDIYKVTKCYPKEELFGLTSQFRRASVSIAANIAEGYGKRTSKDKLRFYNIAEGSINESKYYILLSKDLIYIDKQESERLYENLETIKKLLFSYSRALFQNTATDY